MNFFALIIGCAAGWAIISAIEICAKAYVKANLKRRKLEDESRRK